ncbi:MAG: glycosyltransferase family 4 protein [Thermoanaerobaculia bacterium]
MALFFAYDPEAPSFRHRLRDVATGLAAGGWESSVEPFPRGRYFQRLLERRRALAAARCIVLSKINLALGESALLRRLARGVILDFDDAIYLHRPRAAGQPPGRSLLRDRKFDATCAAASLVLAGNETLAARAKARARRVEVIPTSVDVAALPQQPPERRGNTVVWIGRPENLVYLELVRPALAALAREVPGLTLRVISSRFPDWSDVPLERVPWSEAAEGPALLSADVGVMPLFDDAWTRGKCAFKLLQYMAASLPAVASPVGANRDVVVAGETGYFATGPEEWAARLRELLASPARSAAMGRAARESVRQRFDRRSTVARVVDLVRDLSPT